MGELNAKCSICGKKYHVCHTCSNTISFTPWRKITDTTNCYKIFLILRDYTNGYVDKESTRDLLNGCDLKELDTYEDNIKKTINEILKSETVAKSKRKSKLKESETVNENDE
ncbi:hypothetical protein K413DRAFT_4745 [Clostridium sp. ASBs410]|nr:hypothetical protein K413DRAFT_4745 [Clostridium sp. ASBs410]